MTGVARQTMWNDKTVSERRAMIDDLELQTVDRAQPPRVE